MRILEDMLSASTGEWIEYFLIAMMFAMASSWLYQKIINKNIISNDVVLYSGIGSFAFLLLVSGPFFWGFWESIASGIIFGLGFSYRATD